MTNEMEAKVAREETLRMAAEIVSAYVSRNAIATDQLPSVIKAVHASLSELRRRGGEAREGAPKPAVPIKKSVTPDYIVCLEDGRKLKMLKRHLRTTYNMTPEEYRAKWGLATDYPMVARNYAAQRSAFAKKIGLGRKGRPGGNRSGNAR